MGGAEAGEPEVGRCSRSGPCLCSFDGDDFDDGEEDEGLDDLENAEEVRGGVMS